MKHSLATILLEAIEKAIQPVSTTWLTQIAEAEGYKHFREQAWHNLQILQANGFIRQHKKGKGSIPATWVPTISRIPTPADGKHVAGRKGKG